MVEDGSQGRKRSFNPLSRLTNAAAGALPVNAVVDDLDIEALVERIDINRLVDRIDMNALLADVDLDALMSRIDVDQLLDRVDVNALLDRVDVNELLDRVEPDQLLDRVDPDRLLDRVDPNRLLDRVEPDQLLDRVDTNELIARTDLNSALDRVDFDQVLDRIDVKRVVDRAGVPDLVSQSTGHMAGSVIDMGRRLIVAMDEVITRVAMRVVGKDLNTLPPGPPALTGGDTPREKEQVTGHYAGPLGRLLAFMADVAIVFGVFTLMTAGLAFVFSDLLGQSGIAASTSTALGLILLCSWAFTYAFSSLVVAGRTIGKWMIGERIVSRDGSPITAGQAIRRILAMPFSFLFVGLGFIGLVFGKQRRGLHDVVAGTVVVYDWGDRPAEMPAPLAQWISRRSDTELPPSSLVT